MWEALRARTGVGEVGNAERGDIMKNYPKIKDHKIEDVKFTFWLRQRDCLELDGN